MDATEQYGIDRALDTRYSLARIGNQREYAMQAMIVPATQEGIEQAIREGLRFPVMAIPFGASSGSTCFIFHSAEDANEARFNALNEGCTFNPATGLPKMHLITAPTTTIITGSDKITVSALDTEFLYGTG